jgi:hypothetical protein
MGLIGVMTQNYYFSANQNAKRLHGVPKWLPINVQSPGHRVSHTMTNKTKQKKALKTVTQQKSKKATPFADVGQIVGSKLSTMFGIPYASGVGKWLGSGIGQIFGSGDYQMVGSHPSYNVLTNGNQIPKFSTGRQTNIVCHREYLGDIIGTASFNNTVYPLNPGLVQTFPWLSTVAQNYQEYRFHGLIFEFRPMITDFVTGGAPGTVIMATNYNADTPRYTSKQEMENSEFAVSVKPTQDLIHGVECARPQTVQPISYVRTGLPPSGQDFKNYDLGTFQFATQSNPVQNLGELWVSYCVEFLKPVLSTDTGGNILSARSLRTTVAPTSPLGGIGVNVVGDLDLVMSGVGINFTGLPGNYYEVAVVWTGSIAAVVANPGIALVNATSDPVWGLAGSNSVFSPATGVTSTRMSWNGIITCTSVAPATVALNFDGSGVYPSGTTDCTIVVTGYSSEAR